MKIKIEKLGMKKAVEVKGTIKNQKLIDKVQLTMLKLQDDHSDDMTMTEQIQNELDLLNQIEEFFKNVLKLTDKNIEKIEENLTSEELGNLVGEVVLRIGGASDDDIAKYYASTKEVQDDVKDPLEEKNDSDKSE